MTHPVKSFESLNIWTDGIEKMRAQVQGMRDVLDGLEAGALPDADAYTPEDLRAYLASLMAGYRFTKLRFPGEERQAVSWSVTRFRRGMTAELRRELVVFPTVLAAATLSRCALQFPLLASTCSGLADVLSASLTYVAVKVRTFRHVKERLALLDILHQGWVPLLLWENPGLCVPMNRVLERTPHYDFHVEHALRRRCELLHEVHLEELQRRRDEGLARWEGWAGLIPSPKKQHRAHSPEELRDRVAKLERGWLSGPAMEGDRVTAAAREAFGDEELARLMGFPAPARILKLEDLVLDHLKSPEGLPDEDLRFEEGDSARFLPARQVGRPMRVHAMPAAPEAPHE